MSTKKKIDFAIGDKIIHREAAGTVRAGIVSGTGSRGMGGQLVLDFVETTGYKHTSPPTRWALQCECEKVAEPEQGVLDEGKREVS